MNGADQGGGDAGGYRILAEINMIPLIDVALVLLIIFMVMTPVLVRSQLKVNLPSAAAGAPVERDEAIDIYVAADGAVFHEDREIAPERVEPVLRRLLRDPAGQRLMIHADKAAAFEHVVLVLDAARHLGAARIGVATMTDKRGR